MTAVTKVCFGIWMFCEKRKNLKASSNFRHANLTCSVDCAYDLINFKRNITFLIFFLTLTYTPIDLSCNI